MKTVKTILMATAALLFLTAAAYDMDATAEQYLAEITIIAAAMETVNDDASAEAASAEMAAALKRLEPVTAKMQTWTYDDKRNFALAYGQQSIAINQRISNALRGMVDTPDRLQMFLDHMSNMPRM